ncbi:unnamed protein product, partial [Urochloa humidicola]
FHKHCTHAIVTNACMHFILLATEVPESDAVEPEPEAGEEVFVETEEDQGEPELVFGHFYPADPSVGDE